METNSSFEEEEVVHYTHTCEGKMMLVFEMGVTHDCDRYNSEVLPLSSTLPIANDSMSLLPFCPLLSSLKLPHHYCNEGPQWVASASLLAFTLNKQSWRIAMPVCDYSLQAGIPDSDLQMRADNSINMFLFQERSPHLNFVLSFTGGTLTSLSPQLTDYFLVMSYF